MWSACGFHIPTMNIFTRPSARAASLFNSLISFSMSSILSKELASAFSVSDTSGCTCVCRWKIYCALHQWFSISWQRNILLIINISCYQLLPRCGPNAWPLMQHSWLCVIRHTWSLWRFNTAAVKLCHDDPKQLCDRTDVPCAISWTLSTAWSLNFLQHLETYQCYSTVIYCTHHYHYSNEAATSVWWGFLRTCM